MVQANSLERRFAVMGLRPLDRDIDRFLSLLDIEIVGTYEPFQDLVVFVLKPESEFTPSAVLVNALKAAYESALCKEIEVWERYR